MPSDQAFRLPPPPSPQPRRREHDAALARRGPPAEYCGSAESWITRIRSRCERTPHADPECDRAPHGYYAGKVAQESLITAGEVPWTILRTTQFHDFAAQLFASARVGPVHLAPRMRTQPVSLDEVATRLVDLAEAPPVGRARDLAGPREESLVEMIRAYARATGHRGWVPAVPLPGPLGRAQRDGILLPGPDADHGTVTFAQWLATR